MVAKYGQVWWPSMVAKYGGQVWPSKVCSATLSNSNICWSLFNDDFLQFIPLLSKTEIFQVHDAKKPQKIVAQTICLR